MSSLLAGKTAVVTGASSGIGRAIAASFADEGASVVIADLRAEPIEGGDPTADLIRRSGGEAIFEKADVARWEDVDSVIAKTVDRYGRLDIMVNNAATYSGTALADTSAEQWDRVMAVNLTGMFNGCKRAIRQMMTQEPRHEVRGRLINLGSQHGIVSNRGDSPYGVSKAGAIYMTKQIAVDYAQAPHRVQLHLAGQDRDRQAGSRHGPGESRQRPPSARPGLDWAAPRTSPMPLSFSRAIAPPS